MAKIMTYEETIASMTTTPNAKGEQTYNRFSRKNFDALLLAAANDLDLKTKVAKVKAGELAEVEEIEVTKKFRNWCKKLLEKAGVDKSESARVLEPEFQIDSVDGLYEFFATVVYDYLDAGNRFDLITKEDFQGGFILRDMEESTAVADSFSPGTAESRKYLGTFETKKKAHKVIVSKSKCPDFLKERKRLADTQ